jgi:hypothetical protein
MCTDYYRVTYYFKFAPITACILTQILHGKLTFYCTVLKLVAGVALVRKTADEIRITISVQILRSKENK